MRNTTLVLAIGLLGGATAFERHIEHEEARVNRHRVSREIAEQEAMHPELRILRGQMEDLDARIRSIKKEVSTHGRHETKIQTLIRRTHRERNRNLGQSQQDREIAKIYNRSLAELENRLRDVREQKAEAQSLRDRCEAEQCALKAKYEMTRIMASHSPKKTRVQEKPDPLELLSAPPSSEVPFRGESPVMKMVEF